MRPIKFAISADVFGVNAEDLNYEIGDRRKLAVVPGFGSGSPVRISRRVTERRKGPPMAGLF
jgi:hypothetical protein